MSAPFTFSAARDVVAIIVLTFLNNLFDGRQCVYAWTIGLTLIPALVTGSRRRKFP